MLTGSMSMLRSPALALAVTGTVLLSPQAGAQERARIEIVPQLAHASDVKAAAFTRDSTHVLTGSQDGTLKLWDIAAARLVRTFVGHKGDITAVVLSPDGTRALSGSKDKTIRLWDVSTGRLIRTVYAHLDSSSEVTSVGFSLDGRRLLSSSAGEGAAKLWDAETGRLVRMFRHARGSLEAGVTSAVFSPDGVRLATAGAGDKIVNVWNADTGQLLQAFGEASNDFIYRARLAFSPDGTRVLVGDNGSLRIWDAAKGTLLHTLGTKGLQRSLTAFVAFSPDGAHALSNEDERGLEIWSVETGQLIRAFKPKLVRPVAISPDSGRVLSTDWRRQITLWDVASGQQTHTIEGRSSSIRSVAVSPDGARLLTVDSRVRLWDAVGGRLERTIDERAPNSVALSPDGTRLLSGSYNALKLWDVASGQLIRGLKAPTPEHVAFSADGSRLLSFSTDLPAPQSPKLGARTDRPVDREGSLIVWDAAGGQPVHRFKVETGTVFMPPTAFSSDATRFLPPPGYDQPVKVWDVESAQAVQSFGGRDTNHLRSAAFSPDKTHAVTGHIDGALRLWELVGGQPVRTLWHSRSVQAVAFSRDGSKLLSGSGDTTVKLWDTATGQPIRTFAGHTAEVRSVAFTTDEKRVISGGDDSTVRIWDAATGEQLAMLLTAKDEWLVITPEGFFDASPRGAEMLAVVRGLEVFGIDQFYQELYRPDLVREKLAGDPDGKVKAAAAKLDLGKLVESGRVPLVTMVSHKAQETTPDDLITMEALVTNQGGGIGRAEWRINGVTVGVVDKPAPAAPGQPVALRQAMALDPGDNTVEVVAYNGANLVASAPARAKVTWTGTEPSVPPRLYMLTVGINDYLDGALRLTYAVPDAKALAAALSEAGIGHYESVLVTKVLDSDATAAKLDQVFADLAGRVRPRDVFVFFAAGHGKTLDGRYYFIPHDLRYQNERSLARDAIGQDQLQAWFARIPARKAVLMFDTCEAGSLTQRTAARTRGGLEQKAALGRLIQATGRATLTASTSTQEAYEGHGGHGVFTFALLDALARGDLNGNGLVELAELIQHVDGLVPAITEKRWGARQFPQMDAYGANFPLARQVPALAPAQDDAIIIPVKPTHVSTEQLAIFKDAGGAGAVLEQLPPFTTVTLVRSDGGWVLVARDGKVLGYVAEAKLHRLN
jgi:WD40 repeat protein